MKKLSLFCWLMLSLTCSVFAQTTDLLVTVRELTRQQAVTGQTVYLENPSIGLSQSAPTDANGKVLFRALSLNGVYRVFTKENDTYLESEAEGIVLRANFRRSVTLLLPTRREISLSEVQVRSTSASRINTVNAEVSSEIDIRKVEELPVEGRDITRVLYRLPNVSQATGFFPEAPNVSINGANSLYNNYLIDGMDNNERFLGGQKFAIPVGFARNVTVLTNNYSVEFGNTGNGIINITSKSGSNETTGEVFFLTRPGAVIDAQTSYPLRDLSGNQVKDGFQRYQGGFGVGGALVKNKTFYYLNVEHTTDIKDNLLTAPLVGVNETIRGTNRFTYISGKIDQFWNDRFKSSLRVNVGQVAIGRQAGGLTGGIAFPSAANAQDRNSLLIASRNTYTTDRFSSETNVQYSRFRWNYARAENPDSPDVTVLDTTGQGVAYLGHPGYLFDSHESTVQVQQKVSFYRGNHTFRAGAELISANHELFGGGNPNGSYTVQLTAAQLAALRERNVGSNLRPTDIPADARVLSYAVELRPAAYGTTQNVVSLYAEDQWTVSPQLNVTLGLRYDYDNLSKGGAAQGDFNNLAPRGSFNYKLTGRSALRGGVGLFYDKILYSIYSDALQQNNSGADFRRQIQYFVERGALPADTDIDRVTFDGNLTVGGATSNTGQPIRYLQGPPASAYAGQRNLFSGERRILNPSGYQNPYTLQTTLGYQYQLNDNVLFYADAVYNESYNLFRTRNLNAPAPWDYSLSAQRNIARSTEWANSTRPLPISNGSAVINGQTLTGVAQSLVMTETAGRSQYMALSVNLQKDKGASNYAYRLIYTLSRLYNDTEDINFRAMDANNFAAEWGPSVNDRRHIINGIVNYYVGQWLTLTAAALVQSGQPINRVPDGSRYVVVDQNLQPVLVEGRQITTNDLNGDGGAFGDAYVGNSDRQPGESRNNDRLPWSKVVDISAQFTIPLTSQLNRRIEIRADVFNVLNTNNLSGYSNNATQSNQIQIGPRGSGIVQRNAAPPRQFQFGVRYLF